MNCPECSYKLSDSNYGKFTCPQCKTVTISSMDGGVRQLQSKVKTKTEAPLPSVKPNLPLKHTLCVGCMTEIDSTFAVYGSYLKSKHGGFFRTITELVYDPEDETITEEKVEKFIPISCRLKGYICDKCLTSKSIKRKRKNGEVYYEPIVKVAPRPSSQDTINPGMGSPKSERLSPLKDIYTKSGLFVKKEDPPPVDGRSYDYFTTGGKRVRQT